MATVREHAIEDLTQARDDLDALLTSLQLNEITPMDMAHVIEELGEYITATNPAKWDGLYPDADDVEQFQATGEFS